MVLISLVLEDGRELTAKVSVPLRGLWFLSAELDNFSVWIGPGFPSPCGDYGSYLHRIAVYKTVNGTKFPSPCGDYGSYLQHADTESNGIRIGFRPLAGIMVLIFI